MPNRRTFELIIITSILLTPALSMVRIWAHKHMAVKGEQGTGAGASVAAELF
jgi:hypothetical protein